MTDAPAILLNYQQDAIQLSDQWELFVEEKSRRTGLTYGFAARAVLRAAPAKGARNTYYLAYNKDMTREFIGYCGEFAIAFNEVASEPDEFLFDDGSEEGILALRINFPSGKSIVALSSKPRSLRGMQGDVIIDEAAFHDDLEEVLKAAMALTMWGGHVVVISTHDGDENYFNELIQEIRAGKRDGHVHRTTLAQALADGLYKRICLRTGQQWSPEAEAEWERKLRRRYGEAAAEELDVVPARGGGTYLPRATIEACQADQCQVIRFTPPDDFEGKPKEWRESFVKEWLEEQVAPVLAGFDKGKRSFFGQDFARSSDLSVVACGQIDAGTTLHARLVLEIRNTPFRAQKQMLDYLVRTMPMFSCSVMDMRGNGQQLAEDMADDWGKDRIIGEMDNANTYLRKMPRLKARFDDGTIRIPRRDEIVEDLRLIKMVRGVPMVIDRVTDKADGAKGKRHGDSAIALMNLVAASDMDVQPIDLHAAGQQRSMVGDFVTTGAGFGTVARRDTFGQSGAW